MKVSFDGIGQEVVTFAVNEGAPAEAGRAVEMSGSGEVKAAEAGAPFMGICKQVRGGFAAVQTRGAVTCAYAGENPVVGYGKLAAAENGVAVNGAGREYLILSVDAAEQTVTFVL